MFGFLMDWGFRPILLAQYVIPPAALIMLLVDFGVRRGAINAQRKLLSSSIRFKLAGLLLALAGFGLLELASRQPREASEMVVLAAPFLLGLMAIATLLLGLGEFVLALSFVLDFRGLVLYRPRPASAQHAHPADHSAREVDSG